MMNRLFKYLIIIFLFFMIISVFTIIHEVGHVLGNILTESRINSFELKGFFIFFFGGSVDKTVKYEWARPIVAAGGHLLSFIVGIPFYRYFKNRDKLWLSLVGFIIIAKEILYIGISPLISVGDFSNLIYFFSHLNMSIVVIYLYIFSFSCLCFLFYFYVKYFYRFNMILNKTIERSIKRKKIKNGGIKNE